MKAPKITHWVLSPHALARIEERHVSSAELSEVILNPEVTVQQGHKWIFAKHFSGRTDNNIAAVLLERREHGLWVVVTVMVRFQEK